MAELDRELARGERAVAGIDRLERLASPFKAIALAAFEQRKRAREAFRRRARQSEEPRSTDAF